MSTMPHGYRWLTEDDIDDRSEHALSLIIEHDGRKIIPWDCMVEFGMDHDHDPVECERMMAVMGSESADYDDTDYSGWYGGERGYNDGLRWADFV